MCQQRLGLQAIIQLRIAGLIVTALACLLATTPRAMAANAMVAYGVASSSQPRYRLWNDTAWGPEGVANSVGSTPQWLVLRGSPLNERFALATLDNDLNIKVQIWNEYSWSTPFVAT